MSANVREQQLKVLNETIRNLQTQLLENKSKEKENLAKISTLEQKLKQANVKELLLKTRIVAVRKGSRTSISERSSQSDASDKDVVCVDDDDDDVDNDSVSDHEIDAESRKTNEATLQNVNSQSEINANEARLIALISSFLVIHPFGASLENIFKYVNQITTKFHVNDIENVLQQHEHIFNEIKTNDCCTGDDAGDNGATNTFETQRKKWKFNGFDNEKSATSTIVIND